MDFLSVVMTETTPRLKLPRASEATIDPRKLKEYALNPDHPRGRHKALRFREVLGITQDDWEYLRDQLLEKLPNGLVERIEPSFGGFQYSVTVYIDGLNGASYPVSTRWMVWGQERPWLSSVFLS